MSAVEFRIFIGPPFNEHHGPYLNYRLARNFADQMRQTYAENYRAGHTDVCPVVTVEEREVGLRAASERPGAAEPFEVSTHHVETYQTTHPQTPEDERAHLRAALGRASSGALTPRAIRDIGSDR